MRNLKLVIEYDGTNYCGWQVQNRKQKKAIQEVLEKALTRIVQEKVKLVGSGRTDAGVHAQGQIANVKTKSKLSCLNIQKALNAVLPGDIRIKQVRDVPPDFHARFLAKTKLYRYLIVNSYFLSPFLRRYAYLVKFPLAVNKMRQGAKYLLGRHNFASFRAADKRERQAVRTIKRLDIRQTRNLIHSRRPNRTLKGALKIRRSVSTLRQTTVFRPGKVEGLIYLDIEADGFLYRMVRNIVGTLIEVGRGKTRPEQLKNILKRKDRIYAGPCAPAKGLTLVEVKY